MPALTPLDASNVQFTLPYLSSAYTLLQLATIDAGSPSTVYDASATAVYYISQDAINAVFRFEADSFDVNDISATDVRFFTDMTQWPSDLLINPVNGMLDQAQSSGSILQVGIPNRMLVKHDFIRYLAFKLFNTAQGVDLFNNEQALVNNMNTLGNRTFQDISATLWTHSTTSSLAVDGVNYILDLSSNMKCTTSNYTTSDNLCRELFLQVVYSNKNRFSTVIFDGNGQAPVPIYAGDSISFLLTVFPAANQNLLTGVAPFGGRTYKIKLLVGAGTNTVTDQTATVAGVTYTKI